MVPEAEYAHVQGTCRGLSAPPACGATPVAGVWAKDCCPESFPSGKKREFRFHPIKETVVEEPVDITPYLDQLDESLRDKVLQLQKGRWVQLLPSTSRGSAPGFLPATAWGGGRTRVGWGFGGSGGIFCCLGQMGTQITLYSF